MPGLIREEIGVGIIGTGFGGKIHAPGFQSVPGVRIIGIAGASLPRAEKVAGELRIPQSHRSWEALIDDDRVDAVSIAAPPMLHYEMVMRALRMGKHVLCEKPLGLDAVQARQMVEFAQEAGVIHMVDFLFRMSPERIRLKELLLGQAIGKVLRANIEWTVRGRAATNTEWCWQFDQARGGGVLFGFGVHVVDYLEWLLGPVQAVCAHLSVRGFLRSSKQYVVAEDTMDALMLVGDGIPVSVSISNATEGGRGHWLTVYGEHGALVVGNPNLNDAVLGTQLFQSSSKTPELRRVEVESLNAPSVSDGRLLLFRRLAGNFIEAIQSGRLASPTFEDGWRAQVVTEAVRRAYERQMWMNVCPSGRPNETVAEDGKCV